MNLAVCFTLLLGVAAITQAQAEDYYFYEGPNGELVISNKEPPPGSKIIKQLPGVTGRKVPQLQESVKEQPNRQSEGSPKSSKDK